MREFIEDHFHATVIRWDEYDGESTTFEVIFQGQLIRADNAALMLRALTEADRREPIGKVIFLPAARQWANAA